MENAFTNCRTITIISLLILVAPAYDASANLYVSHFQSRSVSVIDTSTHTLIATITDIVPGGVALSPDGTRLYVLDKQEGSFGNDDELHVYDTTTFSLVAAILIGTVDTGLAVHPDGSRVYVIRFSPGSSSIAFVDTSTNTIVNSVTVGGTPRAIAVSPDGTELFVSNQSSNRIDVIDTATALVVANIPIGANIFGTGIAFSPDGSRAYMSDNNSQSVYEIDPVNRLILNSIVLGQQPGGVIVSLDGSRVYVTRGGGQGPAVINASTFTLVKNLPFGGGVDMTFSPDGTLLYIGTGTQGVGIMTAATEGFGGRLLAFNGRHIVAGAIEPVNSLACSGFESPLDSGPVSVKKNRALPFKGQLTNSDNQLVDDLGIISPPVIQVLVGEAMNGAVDVTGDALHAGAGTDGNQFEFLDGKWHFNLKIKNYSAAGTYTVTMESGDDSEYQLDPVCTGQFVIN